MEEITLENTNEDRGEDLNSRQRITLCQVNEATHRFNIALNNTSLNNDTGLFIAPVSIPTNIDWDVALNERRLLSFLPYVSYTLEW